jgi:hypothetical protein
MRYVSAKALGLVGVTGAAVIAAVLVLASGGTAAGKNICLSPSTTAASCVGEVAAPHFISSGSDALAITKFTNESGSGGGTATHVVLSVGFSNPADSTPVNVNVKSITLLVNGSAAALTGCTPTTLPATVSSVSCPVGNLAGGGTAKLTVQFAASTTTKLNGTATYGEGSGTPGQPTNSVQGNTDTLTVVTDGSAGGGCSNAAQNPSGTLGGQTTSASVGTAADSSLPCTYADAGVLSSSLAATGTLKSQISFVEFPALAKGAPATVKILFTPLPAGVNLNKLKLLEDTNYQAGSFFLTSITVPNCDRSGNIPAPVGIPAVGATDDVPHSNDSCIFNRSPLPSGGGELDLHVSSSPLDGHYGT